VIPQALQGVPGGVAAAINAIWPQHAGLPAAAEHVQAARQQWLNKYATFVDIAWSKQPGQACPGSSKDGSSKDGALVHRKRAAGEEHSPAGPAAGAETADKCRGDSTAGRGRRKEPKAAVDRQKGNIFNALMAEDDA
jgi:hypothetical protein